LRSLIAEAENSPGGFAPFGKTLFHGAGRTFGNLSFRFSEQRTAATARREITLDLPVPGLSSRDR